MTPLKYWRFTYTSALNRRISLTFLTVREALEHAQLLDISKFHLQDFTSISRFAH